MDSIDIWIFSQNLLSTLIPSDLVRLISFVGPKHENCVAQFVNKRGSELTNNERVLTEIIHRHPGDGSSSTHPIPHQSGLGRRHSG